MEEQATVLVRKKIKEIKTLIEKIDIEKDTEELLKLLWLIEREACLTREYIVKHLAFEEQ